MTPQCYCQVVINPMPQLFVSDSTVEAVSGPEGVSCQVEAVDDNVYCGMLDIPLLAVLNMELFMHIYLKFPDVCLVMVLLQSIRC